MISQSHYLLFCDTKDLHCTSPAGNEVVSTAASTPTDAAEAVASSMRGGRWHFVLEHLSGPNSGLPARFEATDREQGATQERLALLSVVRGLEALEGPSKVTLVTTSRYVSRGLRYGLQSWRESDYRWERFGVQMPIRNADLWQRVDCAMGYHGIECRMIQSSNTSSVESVGVMPYGSAGEGAVDLDYESDRAFVAAGALAAVEKTSPGLKGEVMPDPKAEFERGRPNRLNRSAIDRVSFAQGTVGELEIRPRTKQKVRGFSLDYRLFRTPPLAANASAELFGEGNGNRSRLGSQWSETVADDAGALFRPSLYSWWQLAMEWLRWWKGRLNSPQTAFLGT